jgi:hypothetical protein
MRPNARRFTGALACGAVIALTAISLAVAEEDGMKRLEEQANPKLALEKAPPPPPAVLPDQVVAPPSVEAIEGAPKIEVKSKKGATKQSGPGAWLAFGDEIATPAETGVRVAMSQDTQVLIAASSKVSFQQDSLPPVAGEPKTSVLQVEQGEVRVLVAAQKSGEPLPPGHFKFKLRTRTATMGVRGTDFVVSVSESGDTDLHTLKGNVEIAPTPEELRRGAGVAVASGTTTTAKQGGALEPVRKFDLGAFVNQFENNNPELGPLYKGASGDAKGGRLDGKFLAARIHIADQLNIKHGLDPAAVHADPKWKAAVASISTAAVAAVAASGGGGAGSGSGKGGDGKGDGSAKGDDTAKGEGGAKGDDTAKGDDSAKGDEKVDEAKTGIDDDDAPKKAQSTKKKPKKAPPVKAGKD